MTSTSTNATSHNIHGWPPEPVPQVGYLSRKALPIKRNDAEPLTREDVQFDLLNHIFSDSNPVFTSPIPGKSSKVPFSDLYISALYNSSKCSKVLKDKMVDTPAFAIELAKISLLTNVGRINTTMAFFPEMKTALRTYHPVPSLQKTDGNAQDAPRIKNCLKAALLPSELKTVPPSTPEEILAKNRAGQHPPTTAVNLIFVLANHAAPLASVHFDGSLNFLDLFLPNQEFASVDRARAFLWLMYHYLEKSDGINPFNDTYSKDNPGKAPFLHRLTQSQIASENVDSPEEIAWGKKMSGLRNAFLHKLVSSIEYEKRAKASAPHFVPATPESSNSFRRRQRETFKDEGAFMYYVPPRELIAPLPPNGELLPKNPTTLHLTEGRSMLQHAWYTINTTDPLLDSDEEQADEHVRLDYSRRLGIVSVLGQMRKTNDAHSTG